MPSTTGVLLSHLPAIYHTSDDLRRLLSIFEGLLFGAGEQAGGEKGSLQSLQGSHGLAEQIATISLLFDPHQTPKEFVPWLAQWVALSHLGGLPIERQRTLISKIVPLYSRRGTKAYLEELLDFYKPEGALIEVDEEGIAGFQVGDTTVGVDTQLGGERPFWFQVRVTLPRRKEAETSESRARMEEQIRRVIDLAKPAHTLYELQWQYRD